MPIRVMHIIGQIGVGGCEMQLLELCRRTNREKYEFSVCYYSPDSDNMVEQFQEAGVRLYYVNKFGGISPWRFFLTLRSFVRDFRPDIIQTWQYSPNCWGRLVALSCGYRRFLCSERSATATFPRPLRILELLLGRRTTYAVNTQAVADALTRGAGVGRRQTRVIHNAVDMPTVDRAIARAEVRAELGLAAGTPIVLTVGRQTPAKNYPMFYRVAQSVTKDRPDVVFLAAGHGEPKDEAELAALRERMGLGQSMRMLGLRQDVPRLIASADVFCLCSRWEGFPNVLVEAMAGGLPAVCADFAGAREIADDNGRRICVLVDIDNDQQMTADILGLLSDTRRRAELGEAGRESVRRRFSWTRLLGRMDHLYTEFLGGPPGSR